MAYYIPRFVSEREGAHVWPDGQQDDALWEDCVWTSGLMLANARDAGKYPATLYEAERIRQAAGKPASEKGSSLNELQKGLTVRYGYPTLVSSTKLAAAGQAAVFTGLMGNFPAGHRLRRHLPGFTGGHAVFCARVDDSGKLWWMDPLAPAGYVGEWVTAAEVTQFQANNAGGRIVALAVVEDAMPILVKYIPGYVASVKTGRNVRRGPTFNSPIIRVTAAVEPWVITGFTVGDVDTEDGSNLWACRWAGGQWEYTTHANLVSEPADATPFAAVDVAAAASKGFEAAKAKAVSAVSTIGA